MLSTYLSEKYVKMALLFESFLKRDTFQNIIVHSL